MNELTQKTVKSWRKMKREHVFIFWEKLRKLAVEKAGGNFILPSHEADAVFPKDNQAYVTHLFFECAIDFASTHFGGEKRDGSPLKFRSQTIFGKEIIGSPAFAACFYREFGERRIMAKDLMPHLKSLSSMKEFFKGYNSPPMIGERRELLMEVCEVLERDFAGDPWHILEEGRFFTYGDQKNYLGVVELLKTRFQKTFGRDIAVLPDPSDASKKLKFHFDKRANLFALLYDGRAEKYPKDLPPLRDIGEVGPVPDFQVPRSYFDDKIFIYSSELREMIRQKKLIESGSKIEVELRGGTVSASVWELEIINQERIRLGLEKIHMGHLDNRRYLAGRNAISGQHYTRSVNY